MTEATLHACVFCTRRDQPAILFETPSFYVMPDKFPLLPGHILIITKEHRRCHAEASIDALQELDEAASRVRLFLSEKYGNLVYVSESGVARQTVFHAHLHLVPMPVKDTPPEIAAYEGVIPAEDWWTVRSYFARHGHFW